MQVGPHYQSVPREYSCIFLWETGERRREKQRKCVCHNRGSPVSPAPVSVHRSDRNGCLHLVPRWMAGDPDGSLRQLFVFSSCISSCINGAAFTFTGHVLAHIVERKKTMVTVEIERMRKKGLEVFGRNGAGHRWIGNAVLHGRFAALRTGLGVQARIIRE